MNIAIKSEAMFVSKSLTGRVSVVTGSTSGIGLGIARALTAAGSDIVLNGFGTPETIADAKSQIAALNVSARYIRLPPRMSSVRLRYFLPATQRRRSPASYYPSMAAGLRIEQQRGGGARFLLTFKQAKLLDSEG
jgi:hypothetical protein